jgi:hypothetical protein
MLNAFQQSFINLAHILNPTFNEFELFEELGRKHRESMALLNGLKEVYRVVSSDSQQAVSEAKYAEVKHTLEQFKNTSMKYLFFKDWSTFEQFSEELEKGNPEERVFVQHRLAVYVSTLIGEVQKRTVLSARTVPEAQATPHKRTI